MTGQFGEGCCPYDLLKVSKTASEAEIRQAYLQLARRHHPDKDTSEGATQLFQRLLAAYELLSDPSGRRKYDLSRSAGAGAVRTALMEACRSADAVQVQRLLSSGREQPNARDPAGRTALMFAASSLCRRSVAALLAARADPDACNCAGWTAMFFAAGAGAGHNAPPDPPGGGALVCVEELLRGGANPNATTSYGVTSLMLACAAGNVAVVKHLMQSKADHLAASDIGLTALTFATDKGNIDVVRVLLEAEADVESKYGEEKTALMSASALAHEAVVAQLLDARADPRARAKNGATALLYAAEFSLDDGLVCPAESMAKPRAAAVARRLLAAQADPEAAAADGRTPLRLAAASGDTELARLLLQHGANPWARGPDGSCAMDLVSSMAVRAVLWSGGSLQVARTRLLEAGASGPEHPAKDARTESPQRSRCPQQCCCFAGLLLFSWS